jgi:hypothetical protein
MTPPALTIAKNPDALRALTFAVAHLTLAATHYEMRDQDAHKEAADRALDQLTALLKATQR